MHSPRLQRIISAVIDKPVTAEILLFASIAKINDDLIKYVPTGENSIDLIMLAFADCIPENPQYDGSFAGLSPEHDWCHRKILGLQMEQIQTLSDRGYDLTHQVFWSTDFTRSPINSPDAVAKVLAALETESVTRITLLSEYLLCLVGLNQVVPAQTLAIVLEWFDNIWNGSEVSHRLLVVGMLIARLEA